MRRILIDLALIVAFVALILLTHHDSPCLTGPCPPTSCINSNICLGGCVCVKQIQQPMGVCMPYSEAAE